MKKCYVRIAILVAAAALSGCAFSPATYDDMATAAKSVARPGAPDPKAARLPTLETRHFELQGDERLIGEMQVLFTRFENTFATIAREYNLGYEELRHANPGVDHWLPGEETPVYLPTRSILPDAPREGIVLNLPSMRLLYFTRATVGVEGETEQRPFVTSHPVGIGREGWATPIGDATVTQRARDPIWYPPASVRAEHEALGDPLPSVVPAGPDNPLGSFALKLSMPGYLIHGTNKPSGVGMRVSHGCIRLYPEDIEALYDRVPSGTRVTIVNQPVLVAWQDGELFLEVHKPLTEDGRDLSEDAARLLEAELAGHEEFAGVLDAETIARVVREQRGIPFPVLRSERTPEQYLAASRIIENTAPVPETESTAKAE